MLGGVSVSVSLEITGIFHICYCTMVIDVYYNCNQKEKQSYDSKINILSSIRNCVMSVCTSNASQFDLKYLFVDNFKECSYHNTRIKMF